MVIKCSVSDEISYINQHLHFMLFSSSVSEYKGKRIFKIRLYWNATLSVGPAIRGRGSLTLYMCIL